MIFLTGFFVDLNLFKADKEKAAEIAGTEKGAKKVDENNGTFTNESLADEDANLMIKLKFLTYKVYCNWHSPRSSLLDWNASPFLLGWA